MQAQELPKRVADNIGRFAGRAWLLPELSRWWRDGNERCFLLMGGPGTGKSMIVAWIAGFGPAPELAEDAKARDELGRAIKAAYFCQASNSARGPKAFAQLISRRLNDSIPQFAAAWAATHADKVNLVGHATAENVDAGAEMTGLRTGDLYLGSQPESTSFAEGFVAPLRELFEQGYDEEILILVDALDEEAAISGDASLAEMLSRDEDLPPKVRFIVTTRDEPRVLQHFDQEPFDLIKNSPRDIDDVRDYAIARLRSSTLEPARATRLAARVAQSANGIFLYAALVLDELLPKVGAAIDVDEFPLPTGLAGVYRAFLRREVGKSALWNTIYKPLLGCIAVSQGRGLDTNRLRAIVGLDLSDPLEVCQQYLVGSVPRGPFRLFHKSFGDFLLEDRKQVRYHIDAREMHAKVGALLWQQHSADWDKADALTLESLAIHLAEGCDFGKFDAFLSPAWLRARTRGLTFDGFGTDVDRIWAASRANEDREAAFLTGFRCALLRGSINANARIYPIELIARAVELGIMPPARVFSMERDLADAAAARLFAAMLKSGRLSKADGSRAYEKAMAAAQRESDPRARLRALAVIAEAAQEPMRQAPLDLALSIASESGDPTVRSHVFEQIAGATYGAARTRVLAEWLAAIEELPNEYAGWSVASPLKKLASCADESVAMQAWQVAKRRLNGPALVDAGSAVLPQMPEAERPKVVMELFTVCGETFDRAWNPAQPARRLTQMQSSELTSLLNSLVGLIPRLSKPQRTRLMEASLKWRQNMDDAVQFRWRFQIVPLLEPRAASEALAHARRLPYAGTRAGAYRWLAPLVGPELRESLFAEVRESSASIDSIARMRTLSEWLPDMKDEAAAAVCDEILALAGEALAQSGQQFSERLAYVSITLENVFPRLDGSRHTAALKLALSPGLQAFRNRLLDLIAPRMDVDRLRTALGMFSEVADEPARFRALAALAQRMETHQRTNALKHAEDLLGKMLPYPRGRSIAILLPMVAEEEREKLLQAALQSIRQSSDYASTVLEMLAPHLDRAKVPGALAIIEEAFPPGASNYYVKWRCLAILASRLSGAERDDLVTRVLDELPDGAATSESTLMCVAEFANAEQLRKCLDKALKLSADESKARLLISLTAKLGEEDRDVALRELSDTLASLKPEFRRLGLEARSISLHAGIARVQAASNILSALATVSAADERAHILMGLIPNLEGDQRVEAVDGLFALVPKLEDFRRGMALQETAPFMDAAQLVAAGKLALDIKGESARSSALAALALESLNRWQPGEPTDPHWARCIDVLHSMRNSERYLSLNFLTSMLSTKFPLSDRVLDRIHADIDDITNRWKFDAAAHSDTGGTS
jgi:hypothetical protein